MTGRTIASVGRYADWTVHVDLSATSITLTPTPAPRLGLAAAFFAVVVVAAAQAHGVGSVSVARGTIMVAYAVVGSLLAASALALPRRGLLIAYADKKLFLDGPGSGAALVEIGRPFLTVVYRWHQKRLPRRLDARLPVYQERLAPAPRRGQHETQCSVGTPLGRTYDDAIEVLDALWVKHEGKLIPFGPRSLAETLWGAFVPARGATANPYAHMTDPTIPLGTVYRAMRARGSKPLVAELVIGTVLAAIGAYAAML